jgi:hypothetical protein
MTEQESFDESVERQNTEAFGPPEERKRKTAEYCEQLVLDHSEALVREILHALSQLPDFIPAEHLRSSGVFSAPLELLLRPFEFPMFSLEAIHADDHAVVVEVSEGLPDAGCGNRFHFLRGPAGLSLSSVEFMWIS